MQQAISFLILMVVLLKFNNDSFAIDRYWVGPSDGAYSNSNNWNTASNGSGAAGTPTYSDTLIIDRSASIIIDGAYSPSALKIRNNAQVQFSSPVSRTLTIGSGSVLPAFVIESGSRLEVAGTSALTIELYFGSKADIYGTLDFSGNNCRMNHSTGTVTTIKSGGMLRYGGNSGNAAGSATTLILEANSVYEIYKNGGTLSTANYHPNSIIRCTGAVTSAPVFLMNSSVGSYGNYEFNSPGYVGTGGVGNANISFNNFNLISTGTGKWLFSSSSSVGYRMTVNGDMNIQPDCIFEVNAPNTETVLTEIRVLGDINVN